MAGRLTQLLSKARKIRQYTRQNGVSATMRRVSAALHDGEILPGRVVGYETPAWPITELEYRDLSEPLSVVFHCDFPGLCGVAVRPKPGSRGKIYLQVADSLGRTLRTCSADAGSAAGGGWVHLGVTAVDASRGVDLILSFHADRQSDLSIAVHAPTNPTRLDAGGGPIPVAMLYYRGTLDSQYQLWIQRTEPSPADLEELRREDESRGPMFSIIVPVYHTPSVVLAETIDSVMAQTWSRWELCIAHAGSTDEPIGLALDKRVADDTRVHVVHLGENLGIAGNTNAALHLATGDYVVFLDHDDTLAPFALSSLAHAVQENRRPDVLYSDEDKLDQEYGRRLAPLFKPDWSLDLLEQVNYVTHLTCVRRAFLDTLGGLRTGFDGAQDYDLMLRCGERTTSIVHLPQILYHWRMSAASTASGPRAKFYAYEAGRRALEDYFARQGTPAMVSERGIPGQYHVQFGLPDHAEVSVVIPSRDQPELLRRAVMTCAREKGLVREVLVAENGSRRRETLALYRELISSGLVKVLDWGDARFNYSLVNNWGAQQVSGRFLLFLNNDVSGKSPGWLADMLQWLVDDRVGAVGARLVYPGGLVQHDGVVLGMGGTAGPRNAGATLGMVHLADILSWSARDVAAVTGACLLVRRDAFQEVGGFDEQFPLAYGDVDLCLRLRHKGYRIVCTPDATLTHRESVTRGSDWSPERLPEFLAATNRLAARWGSELNHDPFYNRNLSLNDSLARLFMR